MSNTTTSGDEQEHYSISTLVEAIYSTGFVDGQNYAENETHDDVYIAKSKRLFTTHNIQLLEGLVAEAVTLDFKTKMIPAIVVKREIDKLKEGL